MKTLISGGRILDPSQNLEEEADLVIENGKIESIVSPGEIPAKNFEKIIDAKGLWVVPGLIDVHVHLREPGFEYKATIETGTKAAVSGGFTSIACMANTNPVNDSPYVTAFIKKRAEETGSARVFPIGAITKGLLGEQLAEIGGMVSEGAVAISDDGFPVMNSYLMRKAMDYAKAFNIPVITHSEDLHLVGKGVMNEGNLSNEIGLRGNPSASEEIMVARDIALCRLTRTPLHIAHVSTSEAVRLIRQAKEDGLPVTAEVTPHHLTLCDDLVSTYDTRYKVAPPLRKENDCQRLIEALSSGVIDMIASDHAPHALVDKATEFDHAACGMIGLETTVSVTLGLVKSEKLSPKRWVETMTIRPAQLLNLNGGSLRKGADADVTLIDPNKIWTFTEKDISSKSKNSPFIGKEMTGKVISTLIGGIAVYSEK
jgi:dihydroorotase